MIGCLLSCLSHSLSAQESKSPNYKAKKGTLFFYWGYNRSFFTKTNLHFNGPNYDFTLYDLKGTDRPEKFDWTYFNPSTFTIPQYNFRLGYFITDKLVVSGGMDHMKYVVEQNQLTTISGIITEQASSRYEGAYLNEPIYLETDLLTFEHTNGFNLASLDFEYLQPLFKKGDAKLALYWNVGFGGIWIVTKTDVKVMGDGLDNDFHVSGFTLAGKTGPRLEYKGRFFALGELKVGYASLPSVLIKNDAPEIGDHNMTFLEYYFAVGMNFRLKLKGK